MSESFDSQQPSTTYLTTFNDGWTKARAHSRLSRSATEGCASCRISLPDDITYAKHESSHYNVKNREVRPSFRTTEVVHTCENEDHDLQDCSARSSLATTDLLRSTISNSTCHMHSLEYVSNSSPAESESFSRLRRATIRTLSGEQLPRGQTSGPLCFGDSTTGYTAAYIFRLADAHARGRQRYYALVALIGYDSRRAFEACAIIWVFFEQLACSIMEAAANVASRTSGIEDGSHCRGNITPISSFLTRQTMDPDGLPRRGAANVRANGIAALVGNENFFCELHVAFVGMLQELGRLLGGIRVRPPVTEIKTGVVVDGQNHDQPSYEEDFGEAGSTPLMVHKRVPSMESHRMATQSPIPLYAPVLFSQPRQVTV